MSSIINATTTAGVSVAGDNSGSLQLATNNGTTAVTIDTSQNVGIGTGSPAYKLDVQGGSTRIYNATFPSLRIQNSDTGTTSTDGLLVEMSGSNALFVNYESANMIFSTANTERMRIDSSGNLLVGTTNTSIISGWTVKGIAMSGDLTGGAMTINSSSTTGTQYFIGFGRGGSLCGSIQSTGTNATSYSTSSDYRLKENVLPMTGALAKVAQLKPVTYKWKSDGSDGQGFIAHELQAIVPECVIGEKDAVDADGNPKYQGMDTSFLVATLTAALQELKAELDATKAEVQALKGTL